MKSTTARAFLGYDRLDSVHHTLLLNQLYEVMGRYYNLFQPVMRLAEKTPILDPTGRLHHVKRRFDKAQTPFERLCATDCLDPAQRLPLQALRHTLNPRQLRQDIYALLDQLFTLPGAAPEDRSQDVFLTLFNLPDSMKGVDSPPVTFSSERTVPLR